ncbi:MAG: lysophospholipase [Clostridia bacterium]|nr:lysophospholipase [Clostridia bacterium]
MHTETFAFSGSGGMKLPAVLWLPEGEPKWILQITHGMTEHIGRYEAFARTLAAQGIAVAGYDLRGHGQNPGNPDVASFGENGWEASLEDMRLFFEHLSTRFPGVPHDMLGFSLGSFLLREYLGRWSSSVSRAIIMGTGHQPAPVLFVMMAIVKGQIGKGGFDNTTDLVHRLSFGMYNQKFRPNRTQSDWLCADNARLDTYLADPLCRRSISSGLFWQLLGAMKRAGIEAACSTWNKELPVLLISGQEDPVGDGGKGVKAVKKQLDAAGMKDVSLHLIPGARHVLLDEYESGAADEAIRIIGDWLKE